MVKTYADGELDALRLEKFEELKGIIGPFTRMLMEYRCAIMEVVTKLNVLNTEFGLTYKRNPILNIKSRLKEPESLLEKLKRKNVPVNIEAIEKNITDIAGVRVICSFPQDIYTLADLLLKQDDITLIELKDYIRKPKESGYRSLHLIVEVPIFLSDRKKKVKVEIQFRTIAMDFWASIEHQLRYKKNIPDAGDIAEELRICADVITGIDYRMQNIHSRIEEKTEEQIKEEEAAKDDKEKSKTKRG